MFRLLWSFIQFVFIAFLACFLILAVGAIIEFIALHWLTILLLAALSVGIYVYIKYRKRSNGHQEDELQTFPELEALAGKQTITAPTEKQDVQKTLIFNSSLELEQALKTKTLIYSQHTKVVGVTYPNDDGTSRQDILEFCTLGETVELNQQWYCGEPAIAVIAGHGQIGYLNKELAADLYYQYFQDDDVYIHATIRSLTGGYDGLTRGCNIRIDLYKDADEPADDPEPEMFTPSHKPTPDTPPAKRRRPRPPVPEEDPTPEPPPGPHDWLRSQETLDHYIVLDIETTGFSKENDRIIELAAIHYVYGVESERFCTYIDPEREIPRHITALTGIQQSDVANAPRISSIKSDFLRFIQNYPLIGHNINEFDLPFLSAQLDAVIPNTAIDTLELSRRVFPEMPTHKLSDLKEWLHLHEGISHRAAADVETTNELLWACLYPEKYQDIYQEGIRNGFPKPERSAKKGYTHRKESISTAEIHPAQNASPDSPFYGKRIVFTGELSISREHAMRLAAERGAILRTAVSGKTDFLVVGQQDLAVVGADGMSFKEEKAHLLNDLGKGHIQIIDETQFRELAGIVS